MKTAWLLITLAACSPATPDVKPVTHVTEDRCPNWPREEKLLLPATQLEILEWHDRVRAKDHVVYRECAGRRG